MLLRIPGTAAILELGQEALKRAKRHPDTHFFMDEVPFGTLGLSSSLIGELKSLVQPDCLLWIACKKNKYPDNVNGILDGMS